ncbi:MAG: LCP family protein [Propionibacterium sp.]|nr:LCP family protein [Propionibacterium sp.]
MTEPEGRRPRRAAAGDGVPSELYRPDSPPRRLYLDDDTPAPPRAETLWRHDGPRPADLPTSIPTPPPAAQDPGAARTATKRKGPRFSGSVLFTFLSTLVPGLGLVGSRQRSIRTVGIAVAAGFVALIAGFGVFFATRVTPAPNQGWLDAAASAAVGLISQRATLHVITALMIAVGLLWVALIATTHVATRPRRLGAGKRAIGAFLVAALSLGIAAPVAVGARYSQVLASTLGSTFSPLGEVISDSQPDIEGPNPFESIPRLNVLLLGADMDERRIEEGDRLGYGLRTDTIMLASVDTATGETALIQIPRNVQYTPFPPGSELSMLFPGGYTGEPPADEWFINTMWEKVDAGYPRVFRGQTYRGAEGLKQGVEGITGLEVHYFVMLNIDGLRELVDAMGGVTVNINEDLPIGGNSENRRADAWLRQGPDQHLDGYHALWYARSRWSTSDYSRMARQSCLINAVVDQASPATMLTRFEAIARASSQMIQTDIPQEALEPLVDLALKVQDQPMKRLVFSQGKNGYWYSDPDFEAMRAAVDDMLDPPPPTPTPDTSPGADETDDPDEDPSDESSEGPPPTLVDGTQDVEDACAYNPM